MKLRSTACATLIVAATLALWECKEPPCDAPSLILMENPELPMFAAPLQPGAYSVHLTGTGFGAHCDLRLDGTNGPGRIPGDCHGDGIAFRWLDTRLVGFYVPGRLSEVHVRITDAERVLFDGAVRPVVTPGLQNCSEKRATVRL